MEKSKRLQQQQLPIQRPKVLTQDEEKEKSQVKSQQAQTNEKFKNEFVTVTKKLEDEYKANQKKPELHPSYATEWKSFWARRFKEILADGGDPNSHNYKPEWTEFWIERMRELYTHEVDMARETLRKKFALSFGAVKKIEAEANAKAEIELKKLQRKRSSSPISDEFQFITFEEPKIKQQRPDSDSDEAAEIADEPINLIFVCRLLLSVHLELGLLADSVFGLYTKAVAVEKIQPNVADELLFNSRNYEILETVRGKLKGIISAKLVESKKIAVLNSAVKIITTLLDGIASKTQTLSENEIQSMIIAAEKSEISTEAEISDDSHNLETETKAQIAKVITENLLQGGRTDVSAEELSALIDNVFNQAEKEEDENEEVEMEVAEKVERKVEAKPSTQGNRSGLEGLTDDDVITLLRNFDELTKEEQTELIGFLTKLEEVDPERVEGLRKYTNVGVEDMDMD